MSTGFHQYIAKQISPGHCRWIEDIEGENSIAQYEAKKAALFHALKTRVLTDEELKSVGEFGSSLNTPDGIPYDSRQTAEELTQALMIQQMLRNEHSPDRNP